MTPAIDLRPDHRRIVEDILRDHLPDAVKVWVFGSRAEWTTKESSDLDLALEGDGPLDSRTVMALELAFEESLLPFSVDVVDLHRVHERFRHRVVADRVRLFLDGGPSRTGALCDAIDNRREVGDGFASESWQQTTIGDCATLNPETTVPETLANIRYLDTSNLTENRIAQIQELVPGRDVIPSRARRVAREGDILYSTVRPNQRHHGILGKVPQNFVASTGFTVIRGREGVADTAFLYWFLAQDAVVDRLQTIAEHSTSAYPSIRPVDIESIVLHLPGLSEQCAIARVLGALDDRIELDRRMNATLETMARALFKSWFVDFDPVRAKMEGRDTGLPRDIAALFPDRLVDSELGEIPEGWEVSEIGSEVDVLGGATPSTTKEEYWQRGEHYWATPKDLSRLRSPVLLRTARSVTEAGLAQISSGLLPRGTVLLSSRAPIGYLAITDVPTAVNQGFIAMVCEKRLSNVFVLFWCYETLRHIRGISGGSTFAEISKRTFRPIPVLVPPKGVRRKYDGAVRSLHDRMVANSKEAESLTHTRDVMLPKLVSGEVRLPTALVERFGETEVAATA